MLRESLTQELLKNRLILNQFAEALLEDLIEIKKKVIPFEIATEGKIGMVGKDAIKGAFIIDINCDKIYKDEFQAYYLYLKNLFNVRLVAEMAMN